MATFRTFECQDGGKVLKCCEWRCQGIKRSFRNPKQKKEHTKKDSIRYCVEKFLKLVCVIKLWRVKLGTKGLGNYEHLDKTQVKLFPNFTSIPFDSLLINIDAEISRQN